MATGLDFGAKPGPYTCFGCGAGVQARNGDGCCPPCARGQVNAAPVIPATVPMVEDNLYDPNSMTPPVPGSDA